MSATKHRIIRMADEHWNQLAETLRIIVPAECRPPHTNPDSDWQISEGLRMIADGKLVVTKPVNIP